MKPFGSFFLSAFSVFFLAGFNYPPSPFIEKINAAWAGNRISEIPGLIEKRLIESPGNILALLTGYYYGTAYEMDMIKAEAYRKVLEDKIHAIRPLIKAGEDAEKFEAWLPALFVQESNRRQKMTRSEILELQSQMKESFPAAPPFVVLAEKKAGFLARYDEAYAKERKADYARFQESKMDQIRRTRLPHLRAEAQKVCASSVKNSDEVIREKDWPESFARLKPKKVICSENKISFIFYEKKKEKDGLALFFDGTVPAGEKGKGNSAFEDLGGGLQWFYAAQVS